MHKHGLQKKGGKKNKEINIFTIILKINKRLSSQTKDTLILSIVLIFLGYFSDL